MPHPWGANARPWVWHLQCIRRLKGMPSEISKILTFKIKPWKHQMEAIERCHDLSNFGLFFDVGAGKTSTTVNILRGKYLKHGRLLKTLIVGPPIVLENWKREFLAHSNISEEDILVCYGPQAKRIRLFEKASSQNKIVITNYEALTMKQFGEMLYEWAPEALVFDESHRLKNYQAKRTKAAIKLSDQSYYKFLLTGTPILNSMMDIWSQFRVLDGGKSFSKSFFAFRNKYFVDKNNGMSRDKYFPDWKPRKGASEEINNIVNNKAMFVSKAQCLDLPPLVKKRLTVEMSPEQTRMYKTMQKDFVAYINGKAAVADLAVTKALRLQQIVSGFVGVEDLDGNKDVTRFKNPRITVLRELLEELTPRHKVLVWAVFKENYKDIRAVCEDLKIGFVEVHGESKRKQEAVDEFTNDPLKRVFIGHPGSSGIGVNLIAASYAIFYSRNFSLEYDIQAEARNYRGGSERHESITRIDLVTKDTIDEQVLEALSMKKKIGMSVLREWVAK